MTTKIPFQLLEDGTDGEIITWDATGAPDTVAAGTSGHVLTSNGAGAAPTFQAATGGADNVDLTIASGEVTLTSTAAHVLIDLASEGAAATDTLTKINGGYAGQKITVRTGNSSQKITITDGGTFYMSGDFFAGVNVDTISYTCLVADNWLETSRSLANGTTASGATDVLAVVNASGASAVNFDNGELARSGYRYFRLRGIDVTGSADAACKLNVSTDGGSSYDATAANYKAMHFYLNSAGTAVDQKNVNAGTVNPIFQGSTGFLGANEGGSFVVEIFNPASSTEQTRFLTNGMSSTTSGAWAIGKGGVTYDPVTAVDALEYAHSAGTVTGTFILEGIRG